jgi:hypothetical protein
MNDHRALLFLAGLPCAVLLAGCRGTTPSDIVATEDIVATIDATDDGTGTVFAFVNLQVRTPDDDNDVRLVGGDSLAAFYGDRQGTLRERGGGDHEATFPLSDAVDMTIAFDRPEQTPAPDSFGLLPDPMEIGGFEGLILSRSLDAIVLELPETSFNKVVDVSGPCVSSLVYDVGTLAADVIVNPGDLYSPNINDECYVTITLTSVLAGQPDAAFHPDSTFVLSRSRSSSFYSVP